MNYIKGYLMTVLGGIYLLAVVLMVALNLKNYCDWSLYGAIQYGQSIGVIMLCSAVAGVVTVFVVRLFVRGIGDIRRGRREATLRKISRLDSVQKQQAT
jgi:uncharacterized membrane protein